MSMSANMASKTACARGAAWVRIAVQAADQQRHLQPHQVEAPVQRVRHAEGREEERMPRGTHGGRVELEALTFMRLAAEQAEQGHDVARLLWSGAKTAGTG
ncbi:hypothetical protein ACFQU7_04865 [Pseudoroseomonas wenyumeiae]